MSITYLRLGDLSKGHDGFLPSPVISGVSSTCFLDGIAVALDGAVFAPHTKGKTTHYGRYGIASGSFYVEGKKVLHTNDPISCGDTCADGSPDTIFN